MNKSDRMDAYLSGSMPADERLLFEAALLTDPPAARRAEQWSLVLRSLESGWLMDDLAQARSSWWRRRMLKGGLAGLGMLLLAGIGLMLAGTQSKEPAKAQVRSVNPPAQTIIGQTPASAAEPEGGPVPSAGADLATQAIPLTPFMDNSTGGFSAALRADTITAWPAQYFRIRSDRDTWLICRDGLKLFLPADILADAGGMAFTGEATVEVTEYLAYYPMFLDRVSTQSKGELLQSGGSCRIRVSGAGQSLGVLPGKQYQLHFPAKKIYTDMTTFYGARDSAGELDWTMAVNEEKAEETDSSLLPVSADCCNEGEITGFLSSMIQCPDEAGMKTYLRVFNQMNPKIVKQLLKDSQKLNLRFKYNDRGDLQGFDYIVNKKRYSRTDRRVMRFKRRMEPFRMNNVNQAGSFNVILTPVMINGDLPYTGKKLKDIQQDSAAQDAMDYHMIVAGQFNYINCDFFKSGPFINASIHGLDSAGQVRIFFREYMAVARAAMGLRSATFYRCPAHAPVVVIATRNMAERHEMSITRGYTAKNMQAAAWEPFSLEIIRKVLEETPATTLP